MSTGIYAGATGYIQEEGTFDFANNVGQLEYQGKITYADGVKPNDMEPIRPGRSGRREGRNGRREHENDRRGAFHADIEHDTQTRCNLVASRRS